MQEAPHDDVNTSRRRLSGIAAVISFRPLRALAALLPLNALASGKTDYRTYDYSKPIPAHGYAFSDFSGKLAPLDFKHRALADDDVAIDIHYCGICHSDVHTDLGHWAREQKVPQVTDHEIAGLVTAVGKNVTKFKVGDRVGVGCFVDSCGHCRDCRGGHEQYCETPGGAVFAYGQPTSEARDPGGYTQGGYSDVIVVKDRFVIRIPDAMPLAVAAPIMCSAVTAYSPLVNWKVGKGSKVGVVGMGGVGHNAVQLATAMGADVTVFTTSPEKIEDAKRVGAREVILNFDPDAITRHFRHFDFILATVPYQFEMDGVLSTLKREGTPCLIGVGDFEKPNQINVLTTSLNRVNFSGSLVGSAKEMQEVIDYCAANNIQAAIELVKPEDIGQRWQDVIAKKARYRYVIDMGKGAA